MARSGAPLYEQLADDVRVEIRSGKLSPGDQLPSERDLMERFGVSRNTVRLAIGRLVSEGLIAAEHGRGAYVRRDRPLEWWASSFESQRTDDPLSGTDAWAAGVRAQGREPDERIVAVEIVQPPSDIAERLGLDPEKDTCLVRRRERYVDDRISALADSYFPRQIADNTSLMEPRSVVEPGGVLASLGRPQVTWRDDITFRMPTRDESDRLLIAPGTPVAQHVRTGWDKDGAPLRVMVSLLPGDRHVLVYEGTAGSTKADKR